MSTLVEGLETTIPWEVTIVKSNTVLSGISLTTSKLEISASIFNSFVYGEWSFVADSSFFEESVLYIGCKLKFSFATQIGQKDFFLSISNIINGPGGNSMTLQDASSMGQSGSASAVSMTYFVTLVSPWYFDQIVDSKAYKGSVSNILKKILADELSSSFTNKAQIINSVDDIEAIRYRTHMTPAKFIDSRLRPVIASANSNSCFVYTNINDAFCVKDYHQMSIDTNFISIDIRNPLMSKYSELKATHPEQLFYPSSIIFNLNETNKLWWISDPGSIWFYRDTSGNVKSAGSGIELPIGTGNEKSSVYLPISKYKDMTKPSYIYIDEDMEHYDDTYNRLYNLYSKDMMDAQKVVLSGYPNMNIDIGMMSTLVLHTPTDTTKKSLYSQKYIASEISHVFKAHKGFTQLTLSTPNMLYADKSTINNYLKTS